MITKIQMQGVASYQSIVTLETDKKVNIIYGLNGTGKSTLSNYLYSPSSSPYQNCTLVKGADETILVYNQQFIQDHFYEADKLKGIFSLSKENKDIENKVKLIEDELKVYESTIKSEEDLIETENSEFSKEQDRVYEVIFEIKRQYTGGDRVLEYCFEGLKRKELLFNHLSSIPLPDNKPNKNINQIKSEIESISGDSAQKNPTLAKFDFDEHLTETNKIFEEVIVGNTDSQISSLIMQLNNSDWVRKGLLYISKGDDEQSKICPFCQEKTITKILIDQIESYFDLSFDSSIATIKQLLEKYETNVDKLMTLDDTKGNPFVKSHLSKLEESHRNLKSVFNENILKIKNKLESPSIKIVLLDTKEYVSLFNDVIDLINNDITNHNNRIDNIDKEISNLKSEFWSLMRWEFNQTIAPYLSYKNDSDKKISDANNRKKYASQKSIDKKNEIVEIQKLTLNIEDAIVNINNGLISAHTKLTWYFVP